MREWTLGEGVIAWLYKRASFFCMYSWRRLSIDDDEEEIVWESFCGGGWLCNLLLWCLGDSHMLHHILHHGHPIAFVVANPILPIQSWGDSSNQNYRCWSTYHSWKRDSFYVLWARVRGVRATTSHPISSVCFTAWTGPPTTFTYVNSMDCSRFFMGTICPCSVTIAFLSKPSWLPHLLPWWVPKSLSSHSSWLLDIVYVQRHLYLGVCTCSSISYPRTQL